MDDLGKSIPGAEAMVDAEQTTKGKRYNENCLNCGTKLEDSFCPHCGQKDIPRRQPLGDLWMNFISSFLNYEGKFLKTTRQLILKPGLLAKEYNAGKRESYFHPARMYVFISFIFFLLFFSLPDKEKNNNNGFNISRTEDDDDKDDDNESDVDKAKIDSTVNNWMLGGDTTLNKYVPGLADSIKKNSAGKESGGFGMSFNQKEFKSFQEYDSVQRTLPESERDGWFERKINERVIDIGARYKGDWKKFGKDFGNALKENFSKVLFFLLPIFALLLKALYVRRDFFYSEHVVFTIYYYNFFYLAASVQMLVDQVAYLGWLSTLIGFWIFFYLLFAMKRTYEQNWGKTIAKFAIFTFVFFWVALSALTVAAITILMII